MGLDDQDELADGGSDYSDDKVGQSLIHIKKGSLKIPTEIYTRSISRG